jgi:GT2 family glycosyltransferase
MPNFKKLSIVIVNYQSRSYLQKCLASLFQFNLGIDFEIVIVNNDEKEGLDEIKEKFSSAVLINSPKNKGFGSACNLGVQISQGDLLLFLNPDTEILSSFNLIINEFKRNPEIGALGPKLLGKNGKIQEWSTGAEISWGDLVRNNLGLPRSRKIWESPVARETFWISGAALFTSRKVFSEIGGFDENFFMYFEDNDFCRSIRKTGKKLLYFPEVAIRHLGGKSSQDPKKQKEYFFASQNYYFQKNFGQFQVFWLKLLRKIFLRK